MQYSIRPALLVVPNFHGTWPMERHRDFCGQLVQLQAAGHEIYLHGYYHDCTSARRIGPPSTRQSCRVIAPLTWVRSSMARHINQRILSAGEAEFGELSRPTAETLLAQGSAALSYVGLTAQGFVPPAWVMPKWLIASLADRGWAYTEDRCRVYDPRSGQRLICPPINFATRSKARRAATVVVSRISTMLPASVKVRVAIHPADLTYPRLHGEIRLLLRWAAERGVVTSAGLLSRSRAGRS